MNSGERCAYGRRTRLARCDVPTSSRCIAQDFCDDGDGGTKKPQPHPERKRCQLFLDFVDEDDPDFLIAFVRGACESCRAAGPICCGIRLAQRLYQPEQFCR